MVLREPMNGLTHCIGAVMAVIGTIFLVVRVSSPAMPWHITSFAIFGGGMVLLYTASTLYHWLPLSDAGIRMLRRIDHSMIFVYIAATYTPICLLTLKGAWGWSLFGVAWGVAVFGVICKIAWFDAPRWLSTALYLGMGWMALVGIYPIVQKLPVGGVVWLVLGGVLYSIGAVIYAIKKPNLHKRLFGFHELFHVFVLAGSLCHFILMYKYVGA